MQINKIKNQTITTHTKARTKAIFKKNESELSSTQKGIIFGTSMLGTIASLALCAKKQNVNLLKLSELKKLDIGTKEIFIIATGSLLGGLIAGLSIDNKHKQNKYRESLQQFIGNIMFPIGFVSITNNAYKKIEPKIKLPQVNNKIINAVIKAIPPVIATGAGLISGIFVGNKLANKINNKIFKEDENRKVKISDFAAHVDDTLLGVTLVTRNLATTPGSIVGMTASKLIPPALIVPGYITGTASEHHHH